MWKQYCYTERLLCFPLSARPFIWLVHGRYATSEQWLLFPPNACMSGQQLRLDLWNRSNGKQFTVTDREMLTSCCTWSLESLRGFQNHLALRHLFHCITNHFNEWSLEEQWVLFPSNLTCFRSTVESAGNIEIRGKLKFTAMPRDRSLSVKWSVWSNCRLLLKAIDNQVWLFIYLIHSFLWWFDAWSQLS